MWLAAQDSLRQICEQSGDPLESIQQVTEHMQQLLERERETTVRRDEVAARKSDVEAQIERLSHPDGAEDPYLVTIAERFDGVLLSEIYDDITLS